VVDFEAEVEGRSIRTNVKEKEEARQEYDKAVKARRTAFLAEETTPDVFQLKIGHLKPGEAATVRLTYLSELPAEGKRGVRLTIPTTIAPRYVPPTDDSEAATKLASIPYSMDTPAPFSFEVEALMKSAVASIKSSSHSLKEKKMAAKTADGKFSASSELSGSGADMDRDLIVIVETEQDHQPAVFVEKNAERGTTAAMVSLVPSFKLKEQKCEIVFLVDRSGSMGGNGIVQARKALELFLHSLPTSCVFNIYSFGSRFDSLFKGSKEYTDDSLAQAKSLVASMAANYGGTEIYAPMKEILSSKPEVGFVRQIFVLTDGAVGNDQQIISLVKRNAGTTRVFSLGLGDGCSRHLVKGVARAGGGTAAFAASNEDLRPKVMSQLKNALQPAVSDVAVDWVGVTLNEDLTAKEPLVETQKTLLGYMKPKAGGDGMPPVFGQAPLAVPPVYDGARMLVYRLFDAEENPTAVRVTAETPDGPLTVTLPVEEESRVDGDFVHQLAARKRIQDLEEAIDEEKYNAEVVKKAIIK